MLFTPKSITAPVIILSQKVVADGSSPRFVRVVPEQDALEADCFANVERKVQTEKGAIVYGWQIWERPHLFFEAEFHAVWRSAANELLDITPKDIPTSHILFLEDPSRKFEGERVPNQRHLLTNDPLLIEFLTLYDEHQRALVEANAGKEFGSRIVISGANYDRFEKIQNIELALIKKYTRRSDPCICGSGQKVKRCQCGFAEKLGIL